MKTKFRISSLWILLATSCAPSTYAKILYINLAPAEKHITDSGQIRMDKLRNCGFEVEEVNASNKDLFKKRILEVGSDFQYTWIDGHGDFFESSEGYSGAPVESMNDFHFSNGEPFAGREQRRKTLEPSSEILKTIEKKTGDVPLWVDTCFGGSCEPCSGISKIGAACVPDKQTPSTSPVSDYVIDLICASKNDCKKFSEADQNSDGRITGMELHQYLIRKLGSRQKVYSERFWVHENKEIERFKQFCSRMHGTVTANTVIKDPPFIQAKVKEYSFVNKEGRFKLRRQDFLSYFDAELPKQWIDKLHQIAKTVPESQYADAIKEAIRTSDSNTLSFQKSKDYYLELDSVEMKRTYLDLECSTTQPYKTTNDVRTPYSASAGSFEITSELCRKGAPHAKEFEKTHR